MDKTHPLTTPIVVRSLKIENDHFCPKKEDEDAFEHELPYHSAIGALIYLAINPRPDIVFVVNLLTRLSSDSTKRAWDENIIIFRYHHGIIDLGPFFQNSSSVADWICDAGYMSNPRSLQSQTGNLFTYYGTTIS